MLRQTVQRIQDSFETEELNGLRWFQEYASIADVLTKKNSSKFSLLNRIFLHGTLELPKHSSFTLEMRTGSKGLMIGRTIRCRNFELI